MTPEERDRLAVLETKTTHQQNQLDKMDQKLDQLLSAAAMGKGAWWAILKIGGLMTVAGAFAAWVYEKIHPTP